MSNAAETCALNEFNLKHLPYFTRKFAIIFKDNKQNAVKPLPFLQQPFPCAKIVLV